MEVIISMIILRENLNPRELYKAIKQLIRLPSHFEDYWPTVSVEKTVFTGTLNKQTNSVIKTEQVTFIMRNVSFDIDQKGVNRKRLYISCTFQEIMSFVKLINVTINATSMPSTSPIAVVSSPVFYLEYFEIFCPQGLVVANVSNNMENNFSCEKQCPIDTYTFQAGSAVINGNKGSLGLTIQYNVQ